MIAAVVAVALVLAIIDFITAQTTREMTGQLLQERLRSGQAAAHAIDREVDATFEHLRLITLTQAFVTPDDGGQARRARRDVVRQMRSQVTLASYGLYVLDGAGRVRVAEPPRPGDGAPDFSRYEAVRRVLRGQLMAVSNLERLGVARVPVVLLCAPLATGPGALCAAEDLRRQNLVPFITDYGPANRSSRTWRANIIDGRAQVLAATVAMRLFQRDHHAEFYQPLLGARQAVVGRAARIVNGERQAYDIVAFTPLTRAGWGVGTGEAEAETLAPVAAVQSRILLLGTLSLIVMLLFIWWDSGKAVRRLRLLGTAAQDIAAGHLGTAVPRSGRDEIGNLGRALDTMRERLNTALTDAARRTVEAEALNAVGRELLAATDLKTTLTAIAEHARRLSRMDVSAVCLLEDNGRVVVGALSGPADALSTQPAGAPVLNGGAASAQLCPFIGGKYGRVTAIAPIRAGKRFLGSLSVGSSAAQPITANDERLLRALANMAAVAIRSGEFHQQANQLAVLGERDRISRDLHDNTLQALYGVNLALEHVDGLIDETPDGAKLRLAESLGIHSRIIRDIRDYIYDLHVYDASEQPLRVALKDAVAAFGKYSRIAVTLELPDVMPVLFARARTQLVLVVREALANVARHARATAVTIQAEMGEYLFTLRVRDNGRGFEPAGLDAHDGLGIKSMAERARSVGGQLRVAAAPGEGTTIEVSVPWASHTDSEVRDGQTPAYSAGG